MNREQRERDRYKRQQSFAPIGLEGQRKLGQQHVLLIGVGALGSGVAELLTRAGVGKLTVVDRDVVELSNLQRQSLFAEADAEEQLPKAIAAANRLKLINSQVEVIPYVADCSAKLLMEWVEDVDLIIDATDNFATRFVINDVAYQNQIPWIYGACTGSSGVSYTFLPGQTPCLSCLHEIIPLGAGNCELQGIIAPAVQLVVSWQTVEALKLLTGNHEALSNKMMLFDLWSNLQQSIAIGHNRIRKDCSTCGANPVYPYLQESHTMQTEVLCGSQTVWIRPAGPIKGQLDLTLMQDRAGSQRIRSNPYLAEVVDGAYRVVFFNDGRALVHGTEDPVTAKALYHRYLG